MGTLSACPAYSIKSRCPRSWVSCLLGKLASLTYCVLMQDKVDGSSGSNLVTHHPGCRVSGWFAGGVDETIGADR